MDNKSYLQVPGRDGCGDDRLGGGCSNCSVHHSKNTTTSSSTNNYWRLDDNSNDKYTAAIELSNKCREFYKSRLEAANNMKSRWRDTAAQYQDNHNSDSDSSASSSSSSTSSTSVNDNDSLSISKRQRNSIDQAMEKLREEMVSLMDQDLSLMKQLLTLNETIEELKWQRQYYSCSTSCASLSTSKNLDSNWSVSDTEMYDSEDDFMAAKHASHSSVQTGHVTGPTWHSMRKARKASRDLDHLSTDSVTIRVENVDSSLTTTTKGTLKQIRDNSTGYSDDTGKHTPTRFTADHHVITAGPVIVKHEREQNSFDSGIHEPTSGDELIWNV